MTLLITKYGVSMSRCRRSKLGSGECTERVYTRSGLGQYRPACREVASLDGRRKRERAELLERKNLKKNSDSWQQGSSVVVPGGLLGKQQR